MVLPFLMVGLSIMPRQTKYEIILYCMNGGY